jgi:DNA-binding transcriptional LysR family regulator
MDVTNKEKVLTAVENNEIDFALMSIVPDRLNVDMIELMANKLYIVKSPNYQFEDDNMSKALATMTIILREKGSGTRQVMEKYLNSHQIKYFRKIELTSNEAVKQALIAGIGYSIMPLIGIKNELINGDLEIVKHNDFPLKTMWTLVWPKGKNHSPVAAKFLEFIKSQKQVIMDSKFAWYEQY